MASMFGSARSSSYDPYAVAMPSVRAAASARAWSREAIAVTRQYVPSCIAGITCLRPIAAVLSTPQRTIAESELDTLDVIRWLDLGYARSMAPHRWRGEEW